MISIGRQARPDVSDFLTDQGRGEFCLADSLCELRTRLVHYENLGGGGCRCMGPVMGGHTIFLGSMCCADHMQEAGSGMEERTLSDLVC